MTKEALQDGLGTVLGPSGADLGTGLGANFVVFRWFYHDSVEINVFEKMKSQEATWAELSPIWTPKSIQNATRNRAKTDPKRKEK